LFAVQKIFKRSAPSAKSADIFNFYKKEYIFLSLADFSNRADYISYR
jgi:hypothetical protein